MAALLVATEPLFIVILSWLWLKSGRPNWKVALGLVIGFAGVWLLISGRGAAAGASTDSIGQWIGIAAVIAGALFWAAGSIYGLRSQAPKSSILTAGMQMLSGSVSLLAVGAIRGEWSTFDPAAVTSTSIYALFYLMIFGSIIGFTAYSWLLKNAQPSKVATYAYVNPVIAVLLGWAIADELLTGQMLIGAFVVVVSVALVTSTKKSKPGEASGEAVRESKPPPHPRPSLSTSS
jgi:drug/metabolite transporter (DMT)-like permease